MTGGILGFGIFQGGKPSTAEMRKHVDGAMADLAKSLSSLAIEYRDLKAAVRRKDWSRAKWHAEELMASTGLGLRDSERVQAIAADLKEAKS